MLQPCCRALNLEMINNGVLATFLPELYALKVVREHNNWHTDDAFQQSLRLFQWIDELPTSLQASLSLNLFAPQTLLSALVDVERGHHTMKDVLRFAALIHDVGKGETFERNDQGNTSCPGHEIAGARHAAAICARFDFTTIERCVVIALVGAHGEPYALFKELAPRSASQLQERMRHFEQLHARYLLPLLLMACGDLVTSQLQATSPEKYAAILHFYTRWLAATGEAGRLTERERDHGNDPE